MRLRVSLKIGLALLLLGCVLLWLRVQPEADAQPKPVQAFSLSAFSLPKLLQESWIFYKQRFLVNGEHVVSATYGGTISEGQSYAMLKAVWMQDPTTFQKVWGWTKSHLRRPHDHLLGWRWGDGQFGTPYGLMEFDNATDGDQDIAYALLLAGEQWKNPQYTHDGLNIVKDLWRINVQKVDGRYYLVPGTWSAFKEDYLTLDPSYFAPYVYRKFAQYDTENASGWNALADDIYDTLEACTNLTQPKLPPNWCAVTWPQKGKPSHIIFSTKAGDGATDFSYDAFRVYWRMAMDSHLSSPEGKARARSYLLRHPYLLTYWQQHRMLPEGFTAEGQPRTQETSGFAMGPVMVLSHFKDASQDAALYRAMLQPYYHADGYWFNDYNDFLHSVIWLHLYSLSLDQAS